MNYTFPILITISACCWAAYFLLGMFNDNTFGERIARLETKVEILEKARK